jgi:arabinogalactan endo-1,4-beta-galactosidase
LSTRETVPRETPASRATSWIVGGLRRPPEVVMVMTLRPRNGKPVFVAETAYPLTLPQDDALDNQIDTTGDLVSGYPATVAGQTKWMNDVENQALFGYDDKALTSMTWFSHR